MSSGNVVLRRPPPPIATGSCTDHWSSRSTVHHHPPSRRKLQYKPNNNITITMKRLNFQSSSSDLSWGDTGRKRRTGNKTLMKMMGFSRGSDEEQEVFVQASLQRANGGLQATLNSLSKWVLAALWSVVILWRHDGEALWAAMGVAINVLISITLKEILNQDRPISTIKSDPGMPSSHAQTISYTVTFLILFLIGWFGINGVTTILSGLLLVLGSYFSWLRISHQFHTVSQVMVGAVLGFIFSILWFWSWNTFVIDLFVSSLWVRFAVVASAFGFISAYLYYLFQSWNMDET
ncbi:hypothetical protein BUALT_Bualt11G0001000 [Buddleja alternifolia]|uniref:Phosphatidic acid phosphatase type 2/haloperoxidase domain-containing protein n=1 Tax=Buddleja alternifolia TaxID=168488 RepID=A0AAV6WWD7_9LAMI|nr:hypothetical protein BUALT_Bualt11G0001000 [Buddleja alternifolia]